MHARETNLDIVPAKEYYYRSKCDRGISKKDSKLILEKTGVLLQVGSSPDSDKNTVIYG